MKTLLAVCCLLAACQADENNIGSTAPPTAPPLTPTGPAAFGRPRWAVAIDSAAPTGAVGSVRGQVAVDSIGDVVVAGTVGLLQDDGFTWSYSGFVTKRVASDGSERWTAAIAGPQVTVAGIGIEPDDSIVVVGSYIGTADFGGGTTLEIAEPTPPDHSDTFIAKYSWDGHLVWARGLSPTEATGAVNVAVDSAGRIVLSGTFANTTIELAGTTYDITGSCLPAQFVASFDQDGTMQWGHVLHGDSGVSPRGLAVAPNGEVVVVGAFSGTATFGGAIVAADADLRGYLSRFRSDGLYLSSRALGDPDPTVSYATGVAIDTSGNVTVQGWEYRDKFNVNAQPYGVVSGLAADNTERWRVEQSDTGNDGSQDVYRTLAATPDGHVVSTRWADIHDWTAGSLQMSRYDVSGAGGTGSVGNRSSKAAQSASWTGSSTATQTGAIVVTGSLYGQLDFGFGPIGRNQTDVNALGDVDSGLFVVVVDPL